MGVGYALRAAVSVTMLLLLQLYTTATPRSLASAPSQSRALAEHNVYLQAQLVHCINEKYVYNRLTWETAISRKPSQPGLKAVGTWWTEETPRVPVTLTTHLSVDRIPQLIAQCRAWRGPLSAAVFVGLVQEQPGPLSEHNLRELERAVDRIQSLHSAVKLGRNNYCQLDVLLVYEVYADRKTAMMYPLNTMRNMARLQARTPLIAFIDVDLLPSRALYDKFLEKERSQTYINKCLNKNVYIMPAFETYSTTVEAAALIADVITHGDKDYLLKVIATGAVAPFDSRRWPVGHNVTDFRRWYQSRDEYAVDYQFRMEPWVFLDRKLPAWHDARFRGYGNDKIVQLMVLAFTGFKFNVDPECFIVHRAHHETSASQQHHQDVQSGKGLMKRLGQQELAIERENIFLHTEHLLMDVRSELKAQTHKVVLDSATENCLSVLSWWT